MNSISAVSQARPLGRHLYCLKEETQQTDHSDPSGLYSYKNQPSRVLWSLDKFVTAISPLIGYESIHGKVGEGFSEGVTAKDVEEWSEMGREVMKGFEEEFMKVEKEGERVGWMKVCLCFLLPYHSLSNTIDDECDSQIE
jgi:hypothetical protein